MSWLFLHSWHLLGIVPLLVIAAAIFAWPVVGPILARRPWIAALALAALAVWVQEFRVKALKFELSRAAEKQASAESRAAQAEVDKAAIIKTEAEKTAEANGRATEAEKIIASRDTETAATLKRIFNRPIPPGCEAAIQDGREYLASRKAGSAP